MPQTVTVRLTLAEAMSLDSDGEVWGSDLMRKFRVAARLAAERQAAIAIQEQVAKRLGGATA